MSRKTSACVAAPGPSCLCVERARGEGNATTTLRRSDDEIDIGTDRAARHAAPAGRRHPIQLQLILMRATRARTTREREANGTRRRPPRWSDDELDIGTDRTARHAAPAGRRHPIQLQLILMRATRARAWECVVVVCFCGSTRLRRGAIRGRARRLTTPQLSPAVCVVAIAPLATASARFSGRARHVVLVGPLPVLRVRLARRERGRPQGVLPDDAARDGA